MNFTTGFTEERRLMIYYPQELQPETCSFKLFFCILLVLRLR